MLLQRLDFLTVMLTPVITNMQELVSCLGDSYCKYFKQSLEQRSNLQAQLYTRQAFRRIEHAVQQVRTLCSSSSHLIEMSFQNQPTLNVWCTAMVLIGTGCKGQWLEFYSCVCCGSQFLPREHESVMAINPVWAAKHSHCVSTSSRIRTLFAYVFKSGTMIWWWQCPTMLGMFTQLELAASKTCGVTTMNEMSHL